MATGELYVVGVCGKGGGGCCLVCEGVDFSARTSLISSERVVSPVSLRLPERRLSWLSADSRISVVSRELSRSELFLRLWVGSFDSGLFGGLGLRTGVETRGEDEGGGEESFISPRGYVLGLERCCG